MKSPGAHDIIQEAVFTERSTNLTDRTNTYTFRVAMGANKIDIKRAVEEAFSVKVKNVRTIRVPGKTVTRWARRRFVSGSTEQWKKAMVTLKPGHRIDFV
ncbi:MAG TPA: 50S ribosomal protein L23 [bacterium]|nr:50S ribosomal protein L23 [bacterium]HQL61988.1 50S ribosomal protein L23 [bacterium]